jgi:hypothetical protein
MQALYTNIVGLGLRIPIGTGSPCAGEAGRRYQPAKIQGKLDGNIIYDK